MIFCKMLKNFRRSKFGLAFLFRIKDFELPARKTNFQLKILASQKFKFQASVQNLGCQPKILASRRFRVFTFFPIHLLEYVWQMAIQFAFRATETMVHARPEYFRWAEHITEFLGVHKRSMKLLLCLRPFFPKAPRKGPSKERVLN